jgi:plasmid stability protein
MNFSSSVSHQINLPESLYEILVQRAQGQGHSVDQEVVQILTTSLGLVIEPELADELACWEAASDEDWLNFECSLEAEAE